MTEVFDLIIVGAGPCGIAVGAAARSGGLSAKLIDEGCVTSSLVNYPYYMTFFSTAEKLEIEGVPFTIAESKPTRREALAYYRRVVRHCNLDIHQYEEVIEISGEAGDFTVLTRQRGGDEHRYSAKAVVVATGSFHQPNYLGVPGEDLPKVLHYYKEPYPFFDQDVLVVGGGNSAVESALETFRGHARVTLVHFTDKLDRGVKPWVLPDIQNRLDKGEIPVFWRHRVAEILPGSVVLRDDDTGKTVEIKNDWVLAMTGWQADPGFLGELGVEIDSETGIPSHDPTSMETNVSGVYIAGVLAAGHNANKIFIENGKLHGGLIVQHLSGSAGA
ncbi:MAG: YpdA family putative bacillithiol disulfide reductase [Gemmatimonadetes bacterium]|nr:YpdA family putative bacillithiol disulfide reductase [Gemmatimonadota bacterium]